MPSLTRLQPTEAVSPDTPAVTGHTFRKVTLSYLCRSSGVSQVTQGHASDSSCWETVNGDSTAAKLSTTSPSCVLFSRTDRAQHNTFSKRKRFQTLVKVLHHCSPNLPRNNYVRGKRTGPDSCACHHQQELCALSWGINKENQKCEIMFPL